jgi:hypothetical protein
MPVLIGICISFSPGITMSDDLLRKPKLDCEVTFAKGSFFGFLPPKPGDRLLLDLNEFPHELNRLLFSSGAYIPLIAPLETVMKFEDQDGNLRGIRLRSKDISEPQQLTIDVEIYLEAGQRKAKVWILHEEPMMESIAILDCAIEHN